MKKLTALALAMVMSLSLLAGCTSQPTATATPEPVEQSSGLDEAVAYVRSIYKKSEGTITGKDYEVIPSVPMGDTEIPIAWSVNVDADKVTVTASASGMVLIHVNEENPEEIEYVLTASLTDGTKTETLSWTHILPAAMNVDGLSYAEILDLVYELTDGIATEAGFRLYGTVTSIDTEYNPDYGNITVTIAVPGNEDRPIQCYRLKGDGAASLAVGDDITVEGVLKNYKGTYEFDAGCLLIGLGEYPDQSGLLKAAFALAEGAKMDYATVMMGTIEKIVTAYNPDYGNVTVDMNVDGKTVEAYRLKGEGAADLAVGDLITVVGTIKNYNGLVEYDAGCLLIPNEYYQSAKTVLAGYRVQETDDPLEGRTVTGTIVEIPTAYSADYKNITVNLVVGGLEDYVIQCYRLTGEGAENLAVGDTITVTGNIKNYKGTIEFDAGCTLVK